ncbi:YlbG family protein [Ammoniphilus sp. 3BR4]|uniref:YlbG family protein n=1 Tax=Ammoniphilus sp. 3BR4 TaxID=3158265 RepID=UPI0034669BDD
MRERRVGLAVWVKSNKAARNLRRYGNIHYVSRRLNYVSMYVKADEVDSIIERIQRLDFVVRLERSHRHEIPTEYKNSKPDKAKEYDYKQEEKRIAMLDGTENLEVLQIK